MFLQSMTDGLLLLFLLWIVSPYAVVEGSGKAQPGQVGHHEQKGSAVDTIPRPHGGANSPIKDKKLNQRLNVTKR